ncbi:hypothetical protein KC867_00520 [Candidatus Saccharibacteria bacterium]|nr:hypothetical protein [Candidatus Saccharibacteria bacterium]
MYNTKGNEGIAMQRRFYDNTSGMVAIFSVMIIMGLLGIVVLGYSAIVRNAQTRTLEEHLYTQAYYAAESGVNVALAEIKGGQKLKSTCGASGGGNYNIDADSGMRIGCLTYATRLVDFKTIIPESGDSIARVKVEDGVLPANNTLKSLKIQVDGWHNSPVGSMSGDGTPQLLQQSEWGSEGRADIIKLDIIPVDQYSRSGLTTSSYTVYIYPVATGSNTFTVTPGSNPNIVSAATGLDNVTLNLGTALGSEFYIRQSLVYGLQSVGVTMSFTNTTGESLTVVDTQAEIDSTGYANYVARRILVRVPLGGDADTFTHPFSVFSGDRICKLYNYIPTVSNSGSEGGCLAP